MTPIFGQGVVFDAPPERRRETLHNQALRNQALRDKFKRGHAGTIAHEVEQMVATCVRATPPARAKPEVFCVSKKGELTVLQPDPPEHLRAAVELAVRYCPPMPCP
jgi:hypothetical protein